MMAYGPDFATALSRGVPALLAPDSWRYHAPSDPTPGRGRVVRPSVHCVDDLAADAENACGGCAPPPRPHELVHHLGPASFARPADSLESLLGLHLAADFLVGLHLELPAHLPHLVHRVEAVISLLGIREDVANALGDPPRGVFDHDLQIQPLLLGLPEKRCPLCCAALILER